MEIVETSTGGGGGGGSSDAGVDAVVLAALAVALLVLGVAAAAAYRRARQPTAQRREKRGASDAVEMTSGHRSSIANTGGVKPSTKYRADADAARDLRRNRASLRGAADDLEAKLGKSAASDIV